LDFASVTPQDVERDAANGYAPAPAAGIDLADYPRSASEAHSMTANNGLREADIKNFMSAEEAVATGKCQASSCRMASGNF